MELPWGWDVLLSVNNKKLISIGLDEIDKRYGEIPITAIVKLLHHPHRPTPL